MFKAKIYITLKESILDPQGKAVLDALHNLRFSNVCKAQVGKFITIDIEEKDREKAELTVNETCNKLLCNPVIENYTYELISINKVL